MELTANIPTDAEVLALIAETDAAIAAEGIDLDALEAAEASTMARLRGNV